MSKETLLSSFLEQRKVEYLCSNFDEETRIFSFSPKHTGGIQAIVITSRKKNYRVMKADDSEFETPDLKLLNEYFFATLNITKELN